MICDKCDGIGYNANDDLCSKCHGDGEVDWIENIVGKQKTIVEGTRWINNRNDDAAQIGDLFYNTETQTIELYNGKKWVILSETSSVHSAMEKDSSEVKK